MKKLFYFTILTFMLIPFAVRAEINLEEMHNSISKDNKLTIKSIPLEYYKDSKYYKTCVEEYSSWDEDAQDTCLNLIYGKLVTSYLYKNYDFTKEVSSYADCNTQNNTCDIYIFLNNESQENLKETYDIKFVGEYDNKVYNIAKNSMNSMKKEYSIDDMGYINQLINYNEIEKYFRMEQANTELFKLYPEIKKHIENNPNIKYIPVFGAGGYSPLVLGAGGVVVAYYDDIAVGISDQFNYSTYKVIYVLDKLEKTTDIYIKEALKRMNEYINDNSYQINITYDKATTDLFCEGVDCD